MFDYIINKNETSWQTTIFSEPWMISHGFGVGYSGKPCARGPRNCQSWWPFKGPLTWTGYVHFGHFILALGDSGPDKGTRSFHWMGAYSKRLASASRLSFLCLSSSSLRSLKSSLGSYGLTIATGFEDMLSVGCTAAKWHIRDATHFSLVFDCLSLQWLVHFVLCTSRKNVT